MAVCRVEKNANYTVMSNYHLSDSRLSLKAVGLLSKMLSLPENWDYTIHGLTYICKEGRDAIQGAVVELEEAGYIRRQQRHDEAGKFAGYEYVIYEAPLTENPSTDKPSTENPQQLNTKINKYLYTPPIVPPKGETSAPTKKRQRKPKEAPDWKPERFEKFWEAYPKHKSKQNAIRAWDALRADDTTLRNMALGLMRDLQDPQWQDIQFIPHASTWLNQRRWEDEPDEAPKVKPSTAYEEEVPVW